MAERRIEYSSLAVRSCPGKRPTIESLMHIGLTNVHRAWVEAQEHVRSTIVEVADLVDFVLDLQRIPEKRHQWIDRINDLDGHGLMPRMTIKVAPDQIKIVRPSVECVRGRMNTEEPTAGAHKVEKSCLLSAAHRKFSGCVEHHRGVALEVFGRKFRRVLRCSDLKDTGIASKLCQDCLGKRYDVMSVAGRVCEIEDALQRALCTRAERSDGRRAAEERDELASPHNPLPEA